MKSSNHVLFRPMLVVTVALVGLNLRPFMTSIGPVAAKIRAGTGLNLQGIALLTLVPMLFMGLIAFVGPKLQNAIGERRAIISALFIICCGCTLRLLVSNGWFMAVTAAIIGLGVAIIQATFPSLIKREFIHHLGPMMGLYSAMLMGGGALGAMVAPVVTNLSGSWNIGLAIFTLPAILALALAFIFIPKHAAHKQVKISSGHFLSQPRTWLLISCFGLVNGGYTSIVAWLSPAFQDLGWSPTSSGNLLAVLTLSQALSALGLPLLSRHSKDRRAWILLTLAMQVIGFAGLAFAPELCPFIWAIFTGAGLGGCFALFMIVVLDHLPHPAHAGMLSAFMQGGGFLLAAIAPWFVAVLHGMTGTYTAGWIWHLLGAILVSTLVSRLDPTDYANVIALPESATTIKPE